MLKEFKKFIKEASDYLTDNVLNYSCDQKLVNTATNDLDILLDRFLEKIGVNYPNDFSIKCLYGFSIEFVMLATHKLRSISLRYSTHRNFSPSKSKGTL